MNVFFFCVQGGLQFLITLTEELPEDDKSGIARFDGIGDVHLDKLNPFTLAGIIPGKVFCLFVFFLASCIHCHYVNTQTNRTFSLDFTAPY